MPSTNIDELIAKCEQALQSRNFEQAITECRAVLSLSPDNSRAKELLEDAQSKLEAELFVRENLRKAQDAFQNRDYQKCINECQKIQLLDPDNPAVSELLSRGQEKLEAEPFIQNFVTSGQSLFDSGLFSEAIAQWEKVRSIDPMFPGLDNLIAGARAKMGAPAGAAAAAGAGPMFDFESGSSMPELSLPEGEAPAAEEQGEEYSFGFDSDKDKIRKLLQEGDELAGSGQHQRAIEVWSEIFMLDVSNADALQRIESSRTALSQQAPASGMESGLDEGSLEELVRRGNEAEAAGEFREAAQFLSQALAIDADNADLADRIKSLNLQAKKQEQGKTVMGNARAFLAEGKLESARHAVSKILESDPENEDALELMREIKGKGTGGSTGAGEMRAVSTPGAKSSTGRSIPMAPIAAFAGLILVGGGVFAYFSMFKKDGGAETQPLPKIVKKTPVDPKPITTPVVPPKPEAPVVTPGMREAAEKMAAEAAFYLQEKQNQEALLKADEALKLDPQNKAAKEVKAEADTRIKEAIAAERKVLNDANTYFQLSEFAGAVRLYEKYLTIHPESVTDIQPQIIKCYYNLGVIAIRQWRCDTAADYFRQVLFIDENDKLSKDALTLARKCQQVGTSDLEIRKQVTFLEMRK